MRGIGLGGVGLLTGWGEGLGALPDDARAAAGDRPVIPLPTPALGGERFRRATRECLLGVAAVDALLRRADLPREGLRGAATGLVYVTGGAYGASNRTFIEAARGGGALHFPYTAPSAPPAEVTIEFGLTGPYVTFLGGAATTIDALWHAGTLLATSACERVIVLAVETFTECADLWARGRWLVEPPLCEAAVAALLIPGEEALVVREAARSSTLAAAARRRAGTALACEPLIALAIAAEAGQGLAGVSGEWRGRRAALESRRPTAVRPS